MTTQQPRWQDVDFSVEQADPEYMRLIDEFNDAALNWWDGDGGSNLHDCEAALYKYGAWVESIDGHDFWRHPSRKAAQS